MTFEFKDIHKDYRVRKSRFGGSAYEVTHALNGINLQIGQGETMALLGPNGAGKSTLCRIAAGMVKPTSGRALLDGTDVTDSVRQASRRIGVVLGPSLVYHRLRGRHYLEFFAKLYDVGNPEQRIEDIASSVGLKSALDHYIESYSTGMMMRISLARALLHDPDFMVLDEFTMGLDPTTAEKIRRLIKGLKKTVLLTTHNPFEAQQLADTVAFIAKGRIAKVDTATNLAGFTTGKLEVLVTVEDPNAVSTALGEVASVRNLDARRIRLAIDVQRIPQLMSILSEFKVWGIETRWSSLEDAFAKFTGDGAEDTQGDN